MTPAKKFDRFFAFLLDNVIFSIPPGIVYAISDDRSYPNSTLWFMYLLYYLLFPLKEIFGASPGKLIEGIAIVKKSDSTRPASIGARLLRGVLVTPPFLLIEIVVLLLDAQGERIADKLTDSTVVNKRRAKKTEPKQAQQESDPYESTESVECIVCRSLIPPHREQCPKCGWSYKGQAG